MSNAVAYHAAILSFIVMGQNVNVMSISSMLIVEQNKLERLPVAS
jgi:hypothetical protein